MRTSVTSAENGRLLAEIQTATDPGQLIRPVVNASRTRFGEWSTLMRQIVAAAPQEPAVRKAMVIAHESLRGGLRVTATAVLHSRLPTGSLARPPTRNPSRHAPRSCRTRYS